MKLINIGFGNMVNAARIIAIVSPESAPIKRMILDSKEKGLLIPPDTWDEIRNFSPDAVLLVLASHSYDESTYIHSYEDFLKHIGK